MDRLRIAYMAVAMRDPNLVHVEDEYAKRSGLPGVIAHGTFVVSYLGAVLGRAEGVDAVRRFRVDVTAPVSPGDVLTTDAEVVEVAASAEGQLVSVQLVAREAGGRVVARGSGTFLARAAESGSAT